MQRVWGQRCKTLGDSSPTGENHSLFLYNFQLVKAQGVWHIPRPLPALEEAKG